MLCIDKVWYNKNNKLSLKILTIMRKNGFSKHFRLDKIPDIHNTTLPYQKFPASSSGIESFEKYITIYLFGKNNIPDIPTNNSQDITDNLLEIFSNVIDHASSDSVYVCGQYFPKKGTLCLSMCDIGNTVWNNVKYYSEKHNKEFPDAPLEWAMQEGHSTKEDDPDGLGLSLLKNYLIETLGGMSVISGCEYYELRRGKERCIRLEENFEGMFVSIIFNMTFYRKNNPVHEYDIIF